MANYAKCHYVSNKLINKKERPFLVALSSAIGFLHFHEVHLHVCVSKSETFSAQFHCHRLLVE